jgi:hypothetical protein
MLANAMFNDSALKSIPVKILAIDPVPGIGNFQEHRVKLNSNVKEYVGFYARDERSKGFSCVIPQTATGTRTHIFPIPGRHATWSATLPLTATPARRSSPNPASSCATSPKPASSVGAPR